MRPHRPESGETLMGLLVGMAVGWVVLAAGSALLALELRAHRANLQDSHMHHDLRSAMDWMARELRKTQYSAKAAETRSPSSCEDAFCDGPEDFHVEGDTILFSYDRDHNGLQDNNECMGFRLSNKAIQIRRSCRASGDWQAITDRSNLEITDMVWQLHCDTPGGWLQRRVQMTLTAHWPEDLGRQIKLTHTVHLRNDLPGSTVARFCP